MVNFPKDGQVCAYACVCDVYFVYVCDYVYVCACVVMLLPYSENVWQG